VDKGSQKNVGYACNFQKTIQSKQSPNRRKFSQWERTRDLVIFNTVFFLIARAMYIWTMKQNVPNDPAASSSGIVSRVARFFLVQNTKKRGKIHQITTNCTKCQYNITKDHKMDQVSIKYTNIFYCKTLQNLPNFIFLVWKQTIWQPWSSPPAEVWVVRSNPAGV
jgi:hypothetical protein